MKIINSLSISEVNSKLKNLEAYVKGKVFPLPVEYGSSFTEYINGLKSDFTTASGAVTENTLSDPKLRAELVYATAIYRDSLYCLAGRKRLLALSVTNAFREGYQVGKTAADANKAKI